MKKLIRKSTLLFLCLLCSFDFAFCQNTIDTTLRLILFPDASRYQLNLMSEFKNQKKEYKANIKDFQIEGQAIIVTCRNTEDNIKKIINAAQASASVQPFVAIVSEKQEKEPVTVPVVKPKEKYNPDIDSFLNIEDESIFSDAKFILLDKQRIHPRSYKYYCLIHNIYEFGKLLKTVQESKVQQLEQTKKKIEEMTNLANQITGMEYELERSFLSQKQKDYYNGLYDQYVEIWNIFNK